MRSSLHTNNLTVDTIRLKNFSWVLLSDTTKYRVCYLQLKSWDNPNIQAGQENILKYKDSIFEKGIWLTSENQIDLSKFINDSINFSDGTCGTFSLDAGFYVVSDKTICSTIDIGCSFNQWLFSSENSLVKGGSLSTPGFTKMTNILDKIYLTKKN